jgi:thiamine monophosphate synthase
MTDDLEAIVAQSKYPAVIIGTGETNAVTTVTEVTLNTVNVISDLFNYEHSKR